MDSASKIILSGILATTAMTISVSFFHPKRFSHKDFIGAIGRLFTSEKENAFLVGIFVHYCAGILFAFLYALFLQLIPDTSASVVIGTCMALGFCHGVVWSLILTIEVSENHPVRRFQQLGTMVMAAYVSAHMIYALVLGICLFHFFK